MKYCKHCGTPLQDEEKCTCPEAQKDAEKSGEKKMLLWVGGALAALIVLSLLCVGIFSSNVDPFDYTTVSFKGYDSAGTLVVNFDEEEMICSIIGEEPDSLDGMYEWMTQYQSYSNSISYECSQKENLSNGDKVTITFNIKAPASNDIKSRSEEFVVEGLTKIETADVFKHIKIEYEGVSGSAEPTLVYLNDSEFVKDCDFVIDNPYNLSSGDKIVITIKNTEDLAEEHNKIPAATSKTYTVPKLPEYVTSANQIPIDSIKSVRDEFIAERKVATSKENFLGLTYGEVKHYGTFFGVGKDDAWNVKENQLKIYVYYDEYKKGSYNKTIYMPVEFTNIILNPDGSVNLKFDDGSHSSFTNNIEDSLEDFKDDYDVTEIAINE